MFSIQSVEMTFRSAQEGRPIFEDREFVTILIPGDRTMEVVREASAEDKLRFADSYNRFKAGRAGVDTVAGTPLEALTWLTASQVREFRAINVFTVENLASMSDAVLGNFGLGAREFRTKAQAYLDAASGNAGTTKLAAENEALKADIEALKAQMKELAANAGSVSKATKPVTASSTRNKSRKQAA